MTSSESVHDGYTISRRAFKQEAVKDLVTTNDKLTNWPVVYILSSPKEVYVGETLDYDKRMRQHLDNSQPNPHQVQPKNQSQKHKTQQKIKLL